MKRLSKQKEKLGFGPEFNEDLVELYRGTTSGEGLRMKVKAPELGGQQEGFF